ncbi:hypothetical protein BJQ94_15780 [Cryobacterium sp. SO2]|uniref:hypothetical protein n=1 Tax=Cryobacterium sp. SO2 TaxID=1897060 RepID=UPI00223DC52D|nr:hypothetical protein [Cryobacterium sp. SO2]WEO76800.1 hypothetical protein BJQ94_15780 [Cryobacterium sp. SO2]
MPRQHARRAGCASVQWYGELAAGRHKARGGPARRAAGRCGRVTLDGNPTSPAAPLGRPVKDIILTIITGYDAVTLREKVDLPAAAERLHDLGLLRSLSALNEKVTLLRLLDRLDEAFEIANQALRQARFTGDRQDFVLCRIRRAQVMQFQGKLDEAAAELTQCVLESETHEWNLTAAFARETRGKVQFEQDELDGALADFTAAVFLRDKAGASPDELESALIAVAVVESFIGERHVGR